jgi:hypothetical protein
VSKAGTPLLYATKMGKARIWKMVKKSYFWPRLKKICVYSSPNQFLPAWPDQKGICFCNPPPFFFTPTLNFFLWKFLSLSRALLLLYVLVNISA